MPWDVVTVDSGILAIHAALVPVGARGRVVYFSGDQHTPAELAAGRIDNTRVHDVETNAITTVTGVTTDLFCCGHAQLADGRLLIAGGTHSYEGNDPGHLHEVHFKGTRESWLYSPRAAAWRPVAEMRFEPGRETDRVGGGRWYPSLITLGDGQVLTAAGHPMREDSRHNNDSPEVYNPSGNNWWHSGGTRCDSTYYPRLFLLPNGQVFWASPVNARNRFYNPYNGAFVGPEIVAPSDGIYHGIACSAVLLPLLPADGYTPRVLMTNGAQPIRITLDGASPSWQNAGTRPGTVRVHAVATLLPTGAVFVSGGITPASDGSTPDINAVLQPEFYNPGIDWATGTYGGAETWTNGDAATVARNYHSTALLLPDGRVWTAGSDHGAGRGLAARELRIEVFRPPYDADPARPQLTDAPAVVSWRQQFEVRTPQAASIRRVALMRAGSVTHAWDGDQRYVGLTFTHVAGTTDRLIVDAPPSSTIAPPGLYMLWIVDSAGRPCRLAKFVRVAAARCFFVTDRSSFSSHEVEALLPPHVPAGPAPFPKALYLMVDGFLPAELGSPPVAPTPTFTFDAPNGAAVTGITASFREVKFEDPTQPPDVAQRVTFIYDLRFANTSAFSFTTETRQVYARASIGPHVATARLDLFKQPNPYMRDGDTPWLSIDLRVFQIRAGQTRFGVAHGTGTGSTVPTTFASDLIAHFNATPTDEFHPFNDIPTDPTASALELSRTVNSQRVFNFAVAKVRYRSTTASAPDVRAFFRLFRCVGTPFEYDTTTVYRRAGNGATAVPLLGKVGSDVISIPCFAAPRVTPSLAMSAQTDTPNRRTLSPMGPTESAGYFACWLDFNQNEQHIPLNPTNDGPFTSGTLTIQQLMRGDHACLVAEVHFRPTPTFPDLIVARATPGSSDKLSQRNMTLVRSGNPGSAATRTVQTTLVIRTSQRGKYSRFLPAGAQTATAEADAAIRTSVFIPEMTAETTPALINDALAGHGHMHVETVDTVETHAHATVAAFATHDHGPTHGHDPTFHPEAAVGDATHEKVDELFGPDELMILRNTIPRGTIATLYLPRIFADDVLRLCAWRPGPAALERVDAHTLRFALGDATFIPIPSGLAPIEPGLLSLELPSGVIKGQLLEGTVHQYVGDRRRIVGSFQISVPVDAEANLLPLEERRLSVLRHIAQSIPATDVWHPIFVRYLGEIEERVHGFGGDPKTVEPSPDGHVVHGRDQGDEHEHGGHDHDDHDHDDHDHGPHDGKAYVGKVDRLLFDCYGDFEGFVLDLCPGTITWKTSERPIRDLIERACERRWLLRVTPDVGDPSRICRIEVQMPSRT